MNERIVYQDEYGVAVITPANCGIPVNEIARKDTPAGVPYWIVDATHLPPSQYRAAWELDPVALGTPHGTGIGQAAWFAEQEALRAQN